MADDLDDWERDDFEPALPVTKPSAAAEPGPQGDDSELLKKFADEERMIKEQEAKAPKYAVPEAQPKKKEEKKYLKETIPQDTPLDDPLAEKMRRQRLEEQSDFAAAKELFGGDDTNLDLFLPKSMKEFEEFAQGIANKYLIPHKDSKNYKGFLKCLIKNACADLSSADTKDVETSIAGLRSEKLKAEQAAAKQSKGKKQVNVGKKDDLGLDDYIYADAGDADDDFM